MIRGYTVNLPSPGQCLSRYQWLNRQWLMVQRETSPRRMAVRQESYLISLAFLWHRPGLGFIIMWSRLSINLWNQHVIVKIIMNPRAGLTSVSFSGSYDWLPQDAINPAHGSLLRVNSPSHEIFSNRVLVIVWAVISLICDPWLPAVSSFVITWLG